MILLKTVGRFLVPLVLHGGLLFSVLEGRPDWLWTSRTSTDLVAFIGFNFALLGVETVYLLREEREILIKLTNEFEKWLKRPVVKRTRADEFYRDFLDAVHGADQTVWISYFAPYPPDRKSDSRRDQYYESITQAMKNAEVSRVSYRRLVRYSRDNIDWVRDLIQNFEGNNKIDLAFLEDSNPDDEMGLALSTQIVDQEEAWLVAIRRHEERGELRDLYLKDEAATAALTDYYERLWAKSTVVLRAGEITNPGQELYGENGA